MSILLINLSKARVPLRIIFFLILIIFPFMVKAEVIVASGFSSVTEGRTVPLFNFGYDSPTSAFLFHSVGVSNDIYYHNSYMLSGFARSISMISGGEKFEQVLVGVFTTPNEVMKMGTKNKVHRIFH